MMGGMSNWQEALRGKVVMARGHVGRVEKVHAPGAYVSPHNGAAVLVPVVEYEGGNSHVAKDADEADFKVLGPGEDALYEGAVQVGTEAVKALAEAAKMRGIPPLPAAVIIGSALIRQGSALKVAALKAAAKEADDARAS